MSVQQKQIWIAGTLAALVALLIVNLFLPMESEGNRNPSFIQEVDPAEETASSDQEEDVSPDYMLFEILLITVLPIAIIAIARLRA